MSWVCPVGGWRNCSARGVAEVTGALRSWPVKAVDGCGPVRIGTRSDPLAPALCRTPPAQWRQSLTGEGPPRISRFTDTQAALALAIAAKVPVLLTGLPGQGKTATINAIAEQYGLLLRTLVASQREPADLNGLPYADPVSGGVHMLPQQWARDLVAASDGVPGGTASMLFFDEISTAPPALQAACLRILGERVVGDLRLPDDVAMVLAQNPPDFAADGWDLAAPLANRVVHLDWELPRTSSPTGSPVASLRFGCRTSTVRQPTSRSGRPGSWSGRSCGIAPSCSPRFPRLRPSAQSRSPRRDPGNSSPA